MANHLLHLHGGLLASLHSLVVAHKRHSSIGQLLLSLHLEHRQGRMAINGVEQVRGNQYGVRLGLTRSGSGGSGRRTPRTEILLGGPQIDDGRVGVVLGDLLDDISPRVAQMLGLHFQP